MKARIKFGKYGVLRFIGHLDVMRYFQKAMRRAGIPIAFTSGYSPHMIMSFAQPLGLGITSDGEYLDIELTGPIDSKEAVDRLNSVMVPEMIVKSFRQISEEKKYTGMAVIAAAEYVISPKDTAVQGFPSEFDAKWGEFLKQDEIRVIKRTKKSEKEVDIRPLIYTFSYKDGNIRMLLAAGSESNLKPELVMESFFRTMNLPEIPFDIHRMDLYAKNPDGPGFVSLQDLGKEIVANQNL